MMPRSRKDIREEKKSGPSLSCVPPQKQAPGLKTIWEGNFCTVFVLQHSDQQEHPQEKTVNYQLSI